MKTKKLFGLYFLIILAIALVVSCTTTQVSPSDKGSTGDIKKESGKAELQSTQELKKFSSVEQLKNFLDKIKSQQGQTAIFDKGVSGGALSGISVAESAAPSAAKSADLGESASSYSKTNVQVEGVDEADFVKNDDKYIYTITQNKLVIVNAFPTDNAKVISKTELKYMPRNIFVNKDRLIVFADGNDQVPVYAQYDYIPRPKYTQQTHAYVYDISDRSNPKLVKDYNLNGYYLQSRMIGDYVYFIVQDNVYYYERYVDVPAIRESSKVIMKPEIYYFDNPEYNYNFNTVASFNLFGGNDKVDAKTFMMGYANTIYVSKSNIYLAYQKNLPYIYYENHNEKQFYDIVVPLLPSDPQIRIKEIKEDKNLDAYEKWDKISGVLEEMYNKMNENEKEKLQEKISEAIDEYEAKLEAERRKTVIHKIGIDRGEINYQTKGEVSGYLLNQFSMDEYDGNMRVATTTEIYRNVPLSMRGAIGSEGGVSVIAQSSTVAPTGKAVEGKMSIAPMPIRQTTNVMYNNVYVLNKDMKAIGQLEAIAPDERIYSTRFIGDRLYMVTFKRVDPLFVIDLSNPQNPEVLGQLKIPGFSDYLHPYDENHIIGVGKETDSNEWGGISTKGVKIALFDVSDVKNPKQLDKYEIGDQGTDSEALFDHKAFLFDKKKDLLVIPVTEVKGKLIYDSRLGYYTQRYWQGAYVFGLTPEDGFKLKGKITHNEGDEDQNYAYYGSPNAVRRALYMDDVLYTVSAIKIKANDINDISKELKEIKLPYEKVKYYEGPQPYVVE